MTKNKLLKQVNNEDFLIRVRPMLDEDNVWLGQVDICIISQPDNPCDDEDYSQLMHFCKMVCASVPVMEGIEEFRDALNAFVNSSEEEINEDAIDFEIEKTYDGNVVHLNFNTKTGGSA